MDVTEAGIDPLEWDAFVRTSRDGTPFHLMTWGHAIQSAFGHRPHYLVARNAGRIEGVLPLFEVRGLVGGRALVSVPYGVYGGICAVSAAARTALVEAAAELGRARSAAYVELRHRRSQDLDLPTKSLYVGFSRALAATDEENLAAIPRKQRRMTRQGARFGLRAEVGRDRFDEFVALYAESLRNLGSPMFPRAWVKAVFDGYDKDCDILAVWHEGRIVGAVLTLYHDDHVMPYYAGASRSAYAYAVNDFMYWELMRHGAGRGYRVFDFGRSREGTGPYNFKRHWGFEPVPLPYQYILLQRTSLPNLSPSNPRFHAATEVWKRLPLGVANTVGPWLARYLP